MSEQEIWPAILRRLADRIDVRTYADLIDPLELLTCENGVIYLVTPTDQIACRVEGLSPEIIRAWRAETDFCGPLEVICTARVKTAPESRVTAAKNSAEITWREYLRYARKTFLRCLNARVPIRPGLRGYEKAQIRKFFDAGIPLQKIQLGILRTFEYAVQNNKPVTSFGYCKPHIEMAMREKRY